MTTTVFKCPLGSGYSVTGIVGKLVERGLRTAGNASHGWASWYSAAESAQSHVYIQATVPALNSSS